MPYPRPTLTELRAQVSQDIAASLPGADPLLRFSNLGVLGSSLAGLAHLHSGYIDYVAQQATPFTCTGEYLEGWAGMKGVFRLGAAPSGGTVTFTGTNGTGLPAGTPLVRGDGVGYVTTVPGTVVAGAVTVAASAQADPTGQAGARGNCAAGTVLSLAVSIAGISASGSAATAFTGGADIESDESLRARMLLAYRSRAQGGNLADFVTWVREVPGVTRAWCVPHGYGAGTVIAYAMFDSVQAAFGGFPQGDNGGATGEPRVAAATGDQLAIANYLLPRQPVPALVYVRAPTASTVKFIIDGLAGASLATRNAVTAALRAVLQTHGAVGAAPTVVPLSYFAAAIVGVPGTTGYVLTSPSTDVVTLPGSLPVLGLVSYP